LILCLDVDYRRDAVVTARLAIPKWDSEAPASVATLRSDGPAPSYVSGSFWKRELPYLLAAIAAAEADGIDVDTVVIDGYVWLGAGAPGLGARLKDALPKTPAVVGVAKTPFRGAAAIVREVLRGVSKTPLFVTAAGLDPDVAASSVRSMSGPHRIPAMLRRVDRACREA
jgi:deoxyribonuclease V